MTIINIHINEDDKKKFQNFIETYSNKSMSEYLREIIKQKIKIEELSQEMENNDDFIKIPDYLPKNKFIIFVKGAVVAVGDNPSDLADIAVEKFPNLPFKIKYNGTKKQPIEYFYMSLKDFQGWKYSRFEKYSYPIIPLEIRVEQSVKTVAALIDTAASLCVMKRDIFQPKQYILSRKIEVSTVTGIIEAEIYKTNVKILDTDFETEFIVAHIADELPFKFLIGRNLLDQLDAYFLGKKQLLLLKLAEE